MGSWYRRQLLHCGVSRLRIIPSRWFYTWPHDLPPMRTLADFRQQGNEIKSGRLLTQLAAEIKSCDGVLLNGENFIRPHTEKGRLLLFIAYLAKRVFGKPCLLTNHSLDIRDEDLAEIVREVYPLLDGVHFREETSYACGARLVGNDRARLIPDVAWTVPAVPREQWATLVSRSGYFSAWPDNADHFDPSQPYVTVCASSFFGESGQKLEEIVPAFIKLCHRLQREVAPVLLAAASLPEQALFRAVQTKLGLPLLGNSLPVRQAIDVLGNAVVHVSGRWHPGIFSSTGGTPIVALSANNHKMHSLMRQLGSEAPVFPANQLVDHIDSIVTQAGKLATAGPTMREDILRRSRELAQEVSQGWESVRSFVLPQHV